MKDLNEKVNLLKALGHPLRFRLVQGLLHQENCNVNDITLKLSVPQSTVSQQLGILKRSGIIDLKKNGVNACYFVINEQVKNIIQILSGGENEQSTDRNRV
jgi:ArsR family transcriptional regulator